MFFKFVKRHNVIARSLLLLSLAGFLYQVSQVSEHYFKYETSTLVQQILALKMNAGIIVFCPRYADILDRVRVLDETGINLERVVSNDDAYSMEGLLTVEQIFRYTPDPEIAVQSCRMRDHNNRMNHYEGQECRDRLNVTKFFAQEYMCYLMEIKNRREMTVYDITTSSVDQYIISEVYMSDAFKEAEYGMAVLTKTTVPTTARHYSRTFTIRNLTNGWLRSNLISMRTRSQESVFLEKPYDTACIDINFKVPIFCFEDCMILALETLDRIPADQTLEKPYPLKPLSQRDIEDWVTGEFVKRSQSECHRKCDVVACRVTYIYTTMYESTDYNSVMQLRELTPGEPDVLTIATPGMIFVEYFSFICGCFGVWFGVSFLSLDPTTWRHALVSQFGSKDTQSFRNKNVTFKRIDEKESNESERYIYYQSSDQKGNKYSASRPSVTRGQVYRQATIRLCPAPSEKIRYRFSHAL